MPTVLTVTYGGNTAIALDLSSAVVSSTWIDGYESDQIDNTTNKYVDAIVNIKGITGHASTAPVVGSEIRIYCWGADISAATYNICGTLTGSTANRTLTATKTQNLRLAGAAAAVVNTAALVYHFQPFSVASLFGGIMPSYWGLWVTHSQAGTLGASNNSLFSYNGIKYTMT
mgnify:CR=1 FL=1